MRVLLITERWERLTDEGMLGFLDHLVRFLGDRHHLAIVHERGEACEDLPLHRLSLGKGLVSRGLKRFLKDFQPELVLYCPTACATINALVRHRRLQRAASGIDCALLSLQRREYGPAAELLLRSLRPQMLVVLSAQQEEFYRQRGFRVVTARAGVDLRRFRPATQAERDALRMSLGWPKHKKVVLHVGHLQQLRGLETLKRLSGQDGLHIVVVASRANAAEETLRAELVEVGIEVLHTYLPNIEDLYRASDLYLFPVHEGSGSIEFPLSVLEAMACNLPVLATRFGALPESFPEGFGLRYLAQGENVGDAVTGLFSEPPRTRELVAAYSWDAVLSDLMNRVTEAVKA